MVSLLRPWLTVLMLVCAGGAWAADADTADDPVTRLTALLEGVSSYRAEFRQTVRDPDGGRMQSSAGRLYAERPRRFRWEADEPFSQHMVSDGEWLWIHDIDLEQVIQRRLDQRVSSTPALLLSGDPEAIARAFTISAGAGDGAQQSFELRPRDAQSLFEVMRVRFDGGKLVSMQLEDSLGQETGIRFSDIVLNEPLDPGLFELEPPPGADLIIEDTAAGP